MAELFYLPQMGQTMVEGTVLRWLKQEGDPVQGWEGIVELMTDKINMEVEPQITGTLLKILAREGDTVPVGAPIAVIGAPDEDISALLSDLTPGGGPSMEAPPAVLAEALEGLAAPTVTSEGPVTTAPIPLLEGEPPNVSPRAREVAEEAGIPWKSLSIPGTGFEGMIVERDVRAFLEQHREQLKAQEEGKQVRVTPLAARIAAEHGLPLQDVPGTGIRGRITAEDVLRARTPARVVPVIQAREIPLQGMRKVIAGRLAGSYQQAVHVPLRVDVDTTAAADLRRQLKPALEAAGARLTYTDLIAAAVTQALVAQPLLNATLESDVIRVHPAVNLGIAVALDEGLTVPVVRDAHALRLPELSLAIQDVAVKARSGQLPPDAYSGGTFTITNLGQFGIDSFDPIINPPQVAILGVGRIQDRVVAVSGVPAIRPMMTLTLSFDHRALDGAPGSRFLSLVKDLLENPARLLL